jgi:hypothetical protein
MAVQNTFGGSRTNKMKLIKMLIEQVRQMYPYKVKGDFSTYCKYNEGWNDACATLDNKLEELASEKYLDRLIKEAKPQMDKITDPEKWLLEVRGHEEVKNSRVTITPSDSIVACADGCCHAEGYHIENANGEIKSFITDLALQETKRLISHICGAQLNITAQEE